MKVINLIKSTSAHSHKMNTVSTLNAGQRRIIESLIELLELFTIFMITRHGRISNELDGFLQKHIVFIKSLDNDWGLYDPNNKSVLIELKDFLTNPTPHFKGCIDFWDELTDISYGFPSYYLDFASIPINRFTDKHYHELSEFFAPIASELDFILANIPPTNYEVMHENNRDLYRELNAYIFNPVRIENIYNHYGAEIPWDHFDAIAL